MTEYIANKDLGDLPASSVVKAEEHGGDHGSIAVKTLDGGWSFHSKGTGRGHHLNRLACDRYELLYRPDAEDAPDGYRVGDMLSYLGLPDLPVGTVLSLPETNGSDNVNVIVKREHGWSWWSTSFHAARTHRTIHVGDNWTIVHLPAVPEPEPVKVPEVGETIDQTEQAAALPVGSVIWELDGEESESEHDGQRPAIKVADELWMYSDEDGIADHTDDEIVVDLPHRVLFIPASADTGAGSTAA